MNRFATFEQNYRQAVSDIHMYRDFEPMSDLVAWLLETNTNPYGFLPQTWAGSLNSAEMFSSLLRTMHHAIVDNGDMTFISVNGEPKIIFLDKWNALDVDSIVSAFALHSTLASTLTVKVLHIKPNEFGKIRDEYDMEQIKKWFKTDVAAMGFDRAVYSFSKHYGDLFDVEWAHSLALS